ncbi:MAG: hypothetical protein WCQ20_08580 [Synechococcaceae cyanobacterium ELA739]|jgi:hypothetical protein
MHKVRATRQSILQLQGEPLSALTGHHQQGLIVHGTHDTRRCQSRSNDRLKYPGWAIEPA